MKTVNRILIAALLLLLATGAVFAQPQAAEHAGGEANLVLPDLGQATFLGGTSGRTLLMSGLVVALLGLVFGLVSYTRLRNLPVHSSMREISSSRRTL